jgi:hypothetical protein
MMMREYLIEDDGDEVHVYLMEDGGQMGAGLFPDEGDGDAFNMAYELGEGWIATAYRH